MIRQASMWGVSLFLGALLTGFGTAANADLPAEEDLREWMDRAIDAGSALAASAVVVDDAGARYVSGGAVAPGGRTPDRATQFEIGSITKAFTNLLLAELVADGHLRYDTTIGEILGEEFQPRNPAVRDITLVSLATHRSGLPRLPLNFTPADPLDPYAGYGTGQLIDALAASRERQPLGRHYAYSNFGMGLLGHLLGEVHGDGYHAALMERVVEPLGLGRTTFEPLDNRARAFSGGEVVPDWSIDDAMAGAGALSGTAEDFARLARILLGQAPWPLEHERGADFEVVAEGPQGFDVTRVWHVSRAGDAAIYWHNGGTGGFRSFFGFRPDAKQAIALLVSGDEDPTDNGLEWLGAQPPERVSQDIDPAILGQYQLTPNVGIGIFEMDGVLVGQLSGQMPLPLSAVGDDWYAIDVVDASLRFRREDGEVTGLELAQYGALQTASRVADTAETNERNAIELDDERLDDYVGEYAISDAAKFTIRRGGDGLEARLTGQPFFPIFPSGNDVFFYEVVDAELHFERDESGVIDALVLHQGAIEQRALREP
ncbi:MAG: serine hydrolase [Woeseiaceae bacterium]|nr:serine hydrolase [Woeseiaceae bacterium]